MPTTIDDVKAPEESASNRYLVKWSVGREDRPIEPFSTDQEALGRIRELFLEYGASLHVELYLNALDAPYLGFRRLSQWNAGQILLP
jgi:hypothetical protein